MLQSRGANRHPKHSAVSQKRTLVREILLCHWSAKAKLLNTLCERSRCIPPVSQDSSPELQSEKQKILEESKRLILLIRRIASDLGEEVMVSPLTPLKAAKNVRNMIEKGSADEEIAFFLMKWRPAKDEEVFFEKKKKGRPNGASIPDDYTLRALELHDTDPKQWNWPRVADQLGCKVNSGCKALNGQKHTWDSPCIVQLKTSVKRLRTFLKQLKSS
jgi:hypothetical protein